MNFNRKYAAIATATAVLTTGIGAFLFSHGNGATAPNDPATAQSITVQAKDTSGAALSGVAVQLTGAGNKQITSGTTTTGGQVSLTFNPEPGTYVVTASEPTGYRAHDDKDGGASDVNGLNCSNVYLCIYLTATEMQNPDGTTSMTVALSHVRPEQVSELDDLWFEMTPPPIAVEEESFVEVDETDDLLIGEPGNDVQIAHSADDEIIDADIVDDGVIVDAETVDSSEDEVMVTAARMTQFCASTQHQQVVDQNAASGVWIRGTVELGDEGWIFVEGPTFNNGEPVQIPVQGGVFDAPLGINSYGDHEITHFEFQGSGPTDSPINLLPALIEGPGPIFPVDSNEGPVFDNECFDFDAPATDTAVQPAAQPATEPADAPEQSDEQQAEQALTEATNEVETFLNEFVNSHINNDSAGLLDTLHPAVPLAFGDDVCSDYVARTTGSIVGSNVLTVGPPTSIEMDSPNGSISFPEAIPFTVEFSLIDGTTVVNDANLAQHDGTAHWLTRCGVGG